MIAIQKKTIEGDYSDLLKEFGKGDELNFAILADCICQHLNEIQKLENRACVSVKTLQKKLIESIPEELIMFNSEDKNLQ
jgi:hypothetical protein